MQKLDLVIIGGGAAGIVAAISAKRKGCSVLLCDRMPKLGKKILASGNGRCNLSNESLDESFYNQASRDFVRSVFAGFGKDRILGFFKELGLETYSEEGRIFPRTNQASSVLKILEMELERLSVPVELNFDTIRVSHTNGRFMISSKGNKNIECEKLVMAGGGRSYPALGSDGSCFALAESLGHRIIAPVPAAVPLVTKDRLLHFLQGQKIPASVKAVVGGRPVCVSTGDLLFTKYGLSGTAILDVSEEISQAMNRNNEKDVSVYVDMVPFIKEDALGGEIKKRLDRRVAEENLLVGILPNKFAVALKDELAKRDAVSIAGALKNRFFKITGTRGWNEAEFTSGGVDTKEIKERTLESKLVKGLYFAGEVLDVCGKRGGYNLAWAWASGFTAGLTG